MNANKANAMRRKRYRMQRGQATTEIAVFGIMVLVVFGFLLRFGQILEAKQWTKMYSFRRALEVAKKRFDNGYYGQATFVAMRDIYPVNVMGMEREPVMIDGSASVGLDNRQACYVTEGKPDRRNDNYVGGTYYQVGTSMINNGTVLLMPRMTVTRRIDDSRGPKTPWDSSLKLVRGLDDDDDTYQSREAVPVERTQIGISTAINQAGMRQETPDDMTYVEASDYTLTQVTNYTFKDVNAIKEEDGFIETVDALPASSNMVVQQAKHMQNSKTWTVEK